MSDGVEDHDAIAAEAEAAPAEETEPGPFISFAQNLEDVILWRALRHVQGGTYIDLGAAWPRLDSVTAAFYDRGWSGVNVDPNPEMHEQLVAERTRDQNLCVAVGASQGQVGFRVVKATGLSTIDPDVADAYAAAGRFVEVRSVPMTTLAQIWSEHIPVGSHVHFLKIDVEGAERDVLLGNDWERYRPWIVVIEATSPGTQVDTSSNWHSLIEGHGYRSVYFDGLNRFYVANEHAELGGVLCLPPNVFDGYVTAGYAEALERLHSARLGLRREQELAERERLRHANEIAQLHVDLRKAKQFAERARHVLELAASQPTMPSEVGSSLGQGSASGVSPPYGRLPRPAAVMLRSIRHPLLYARVAFARIWMLLTGKSVPRAASAVAAPRTDDANQRLSEHARRLLQLLDSVD